jgi:hypothetical protein
MMAEAEGSTPLTPQPAINFLHLYLIISIIYLLSSSPPFPPSLPPSPSTSRFFLNFLPLYLLINIFYLLSSSPFPHSLPPPPSTSRFFLFFISSFFISLLVFYSFSLLLFIFRLLFHLLLEIQVSFSH